MRRVVIIGAGVVGTATACALAGHAEVVLLDTGEVGGGTSSRGFGRLSAWGKRPDSYFRLAQEGIRAHLASPGPWLHQCGTLLHGAAADRAQAERLGCVVEQTGDAVFLPEEGWVDGGLYARSMAAESGAEVLTGHEVVGLRPGWEVEFACGEALPADIVINAAGVGAPRVAAFAGYTLRLLRRRGAVVELALPGHPLKTIVHSDDVTIRPIDTDRLLMRGPSGDEALARREPVAKPLLELAATLLPWLADATVRAVRVGDRVSPAEGLPNIALVVPGYLHAVADCAVNLAPVIAQRLARLVRTSH